jgi:Peptidase family M48
MTMTYRADVQLHAGEPASKTAIRVRHRAGLIFRGQEWLYNLIRPGVKAVARMSALPCVHPSPRPRVVSYAFDKLRRMTRTRSSVLPCGAGTGVAPASAARDKSTGDRVCLTRRLLGCLPLCALILISACSINPTTGRDQFLAIPAVQSVQVDMGMALKVCTPAAATPTDNGPWAGYAASRCPETGQSAKFRRQVERIGAELAIEARLFSPELFQRIDSFRIEVSQDAEGGTASNSRGHIAISSELARTDPTDDVVAFLIAREMGHMIARHDEEDAGVRMAFSALTALVPGGSLIARLAASTLGSLGLTRSWANDQRREADAVALALLKRTDRSREVIALNLRAGLSRDQLRTSQWSAQLLESIERLGRKEPVRPVEQFLALALR